MQNTLDCDVVVAGAGPAGAAAAAHLAKAGLDVILADWQTFPRDKVCGDFVSPVALRELSRLRFGAKLPSGSANVIRTASVYLDGKHLLAGAIPKVAGLPRFGRVIPRKVLDEWVLNRARAMGARVFEGHRVRGFRSSPEWIEIEVQSGAVAQTLRAKVLIGADGSISNIARAVRGGAAVPNQDRIIALRGYFEGVRGPSDRADLYFGSEMFPGYCWLFPIGNEQANVGLGVVRQTIPLYPEHIRESLQRLIESDPALKQRLDGARPVGTIAGWPLTTYNGRLPLVAERVILIGDAAGLINPLNGEGIQYALLSARWAAEVIVACQSQTGFSTAALNAYTARVRSEIDDDLMVARALVQLISNRSLNPLWLEALKIITVKASSDPEYAQIAGGVLAGVIPACNLLRLPVLQGTLQQAVLYLGTRAVQGLSRPPANLVELGVRLTKAAINVLSPILTHREESETWALNLVESAMGVARVATKNVNLRAEQPAARRRTRSARTSKFQSHAAR